MAWVEKDHNDHVVSTPCHGQGCQPPDQAAQSHIQPGLECLQGCGIHSLLGQPVPVCHHPLSAFFVSVVVRNTCQFGPLFCFKQVSAVLLLSGSFKFSILNRGPDMASEGISEQESLPTTPLLMTIKCMLTSAFVLFPSDSWSSPSQPLVPVCLF